MYIDLVSAKYKGGYKIELAFEDGKSGVVDFTKYIEKGGVFRQLSELELFKQFEVNEELGVLTWKNEIDVAPEVFYSEATGESLPEWMREESPLQETA